MNAHNDGGPAFPTTPNNDCFGNDGMSLRDYFAAKAMVALLPQLVAEFDKASARDGRSAATQTERGCQAAYKIADAMLKARTE